MFELYPHFQDWHVPHAVVLCNLQPSSVFCCVIRLLPKVPKG